MGNPTINKSILYTTIADTMPMEGRDFSIDTEVDQSGNAVVIVTPLTAVGRGFVPALIESISARKGTGFTVREGGSGAQEVVTVRSLRANIEREAAASREKRIQAEKENNKKLTAALDEARKNNNRSAIMSSSRELSQSNARLQTMEAAFKKITELKPGIQKAAIEAAQEDKKNGESWDIDMDAPLTTLFDRQNAADTLNGYERSVEELAMHLATADEFREAAITSLKQYALQKEEK